MLSKNIFNLSKIHCLLLLVFSYNFVINKKLEETMEINNKSQNIGLIYQQLSSQKSELSSVDKNDKSTFEKNDSVEVSNDKNPQRDEESKKIENMISSAPSLDNAKEEISKNGNLNKMLLQNLQQGVSYDS